MKLKHIAAKAKVSVATVSRVLNDPGRVKEHTPAPKNNTDLARLDQYRATQIRYISQVHDMRGVQPHQGRSVSRRIAQGEALERMAPPPPIPRPRPSGGGGRGRGLRSQDPSTDGLNYVARRLTG